MAMAVNTVKVETTNTNEVLPMKVFRCRLLDISIGVGSRYGFSTAYFEVALYNSPQRQF